MKILVLLAVANLWLGSVASAAPALAGQRQLVFILTDDQGCGDLSVTETYPQGPTSTSHAGRTHRFLYQSHLLATRRLARTPWFRNGVHTISSAASQQSHDTPQVLKSAGYTTAIFGKWHLGDERKYWPSRRGFDEMFIHGAGGIGQTYAGSCGDAPGNTYSNPAILHNGKFVRTDGYCTDVFFAQTARWIESVKGTTVFA
jgi:arylsulfatase